MYHGGPRGLKEILPPSLSGASRAGGGIPGPSRADRIYVTTSLTAALLYAAVHEKPMIYIVTAIGPLAPDPDCSVPGLSFEAVAVRIDGTRKPKWKAINRAREALNMQYPGETDLKMGGKSIHGQR